MVYFGFYFILLALSSASEIFAKQHLRGSRFFFLLYGLGQAAIETSCLAALAGVLRRCLPRFCFLLYIGGTFLLLILHLLDGLMNRILDLSIWETIGFVLDENLENFLYLLDASGVPLWAWGAIFSSFLLIPLLGIFFYCCTELLTQRLPLHFSREKKLLAGFCTCAALLFWDVTASNTIHPDDYTAFVQSLPWKFTFLEPKTVVLPLPGTLQRAPDEEAVQGAIQRDETKLSHKPNLYLFIIESLRDDMITEATAPHLHAFSKTAASSRYFLSGANGTMLSWYAIFHSQFAHHWPCMKHRCWEMGSPALALLKKWGYQIRVYTSAQLGYYGMEALLFGKENALLDSYQTFHHLPPLSAAESDAKALQALQRDLEENPSLQEGQVFILFWDSTHFDYSWPKDWTPKFHPISNEFAYFRTFHSQNEIEKIKNRYRNAVNYVDFLFGKFLEKLPHKEEAIVVVSGDHGEEFFEQGHLFHGSHLVKEQTQVPLYIRLGSKETSPRKILSQIDIFPSILDALSGNIPDFLSGQSVLREEVWPFAIAMRFNAGRPPHEFFIHNGTHKLVARFSNKKDIFQSKALYIRSVRGADDRVFSPTEECSRDWIVKEFGKALEKLVTAKD